MWKNSLVIDAVAHAFDWSTANRAPSLSEEQFEGFTEYMYATTHAATESRAPGYLMSHAEFTQTFTAEDIERVYIDETDVDMICYHEVQIPGVFADGPVPFEVGAELKERYPERVLFYAFVDPFQGTAELERMQEKTERCQVDGFKFYPTDGVFNMSTGRQNEILYDNPEIAFPFFEKARELGVMHLAFHKAFPVGPGPLDRDRVEDISAAACSFPDMTFEVVHSGWAFLEDCALQLALNPNVYANLELTVNYAARRPRQFAEILGTFLRQGPGVEDRILFASGIPVGHPQPVLQAFVDMEMPQDLVEGYEMPPVTDAIKKKILGENMATLHGIDVASKLDAIRSDRWAREREARSDDARETPWSTHLDRVRATA